MNWVKLIPSFIKRIGSHAFAFCYVEDLSISDIVTEIGDFAFFNCRKLQVVSFSSKSNLKIIEKGSFSGQ